MSLPTQTDILIVGAGPSGLACAITLAGQGLQVTIVDALPTAENGSRAAVIHARTLEVLHTLGLSKPLLHTGVHSSGVTFLGEDELLLDVNMRKLHEDTEFPVMLLLPQHDLETIFISKLAAAGVQVLRNRSVIGMKSGTKRGMEVTFQDGTSIRARYLVGADGSKSTIRSLAGIDFADPRTGVPYEAPGPPSSLFQIVFADITLEEPLPPTLVRDALSWHLNKLFLLLPLPADTLPAAARDAAWEKKRTSFWRIGIVSNGTLIPRHPDIEYLQREIDERKPWEGPVRVASLVSRPTTYRVRCAVAGTFFRKMGEGNVLLVGDAAHVHAPTGGQGMNLGICDAVALGHALTRAVRAPSALESDCALREYSDRRRETAVRVIGMTKRLTAVINACTWWQRLVRNTAFWIAGCFPWVCRAAAWRLSGLVNRDGLR